MKSITSIKATSFKNSIGAKLTINSNCTFAITTTSKGNKLYIYDTPYGLVKMTHADRQLAYKFAQAKLNDLEREIKYAKKFVTKMREYNVTTDYFPNHVVLSRYNESDETLLQITDEGVSHFYAIRFGTVLHFCSRGKANFNDMIKFIEERISFAKTPQQKFMVIASLDYNWKYTS